MNAAARISLRRVVVATLLLGWLVSVAAAQTVLADPDLASLPWLQIALGALIATWGGMTATLGRYLAAQYDAKPFLWRAEVARDGAVSVTVGAGAYMAGAWYQLHVMLLGLTLLLAGYLGVRLLSAAAERLMTVFTTKKDVL